MKKRSIFWGVFLICGALALVLLQINPTLFNRLNSFSNTWGIVLGILLIPVLLDSLWHLNFVISSLALGGIAWVFAESWLVERNLEFWILMVAALLLGVGCEIVFSGFKKQRKQKRRWARWQKKHGGEWNGQWQINSSSAGGEWFQESTEEHLDGEQLYFSNKFGETSKYLHSQNLQQVNSRLAFGQMNIYFEDCVLYEGRAVVRISNAFGATCLYVPRTWRVLNNVDVFAGAVEFIGHSGAVDDSPHLFLEGNVKFGAVEVKYV